MLLYSSKSAGHFLVGLCLGFLLCSVDQYFYPSSNITVLLLLLYMSWYRVDWLLPFYSFLKTVLAILVPSTLHIFQSKHAYYRSTRRSTDLLVGCLTGIVLKLCTYFGRTGISFISMTNSSVDMRQPFLYTVCFW